MFRCEKINLYVRKCKKIFLSVIKYVPALRALCGQSIKFFLKQDFHILNNALLVLLNCAQLESHSTVNYHDCALYSL